MISSVWRFFQIWVESVRGWQDWRTWDGKTKIFNHSLAFFSSAAKTKNKTSEEAQLFITDCFQSAMQEWASALLEANRISTYLVNRMKHPIARKYEISKHHVNRNLRPPANNNNITKKPKPYYIATYLVLNSYAADGYASRPWNDVMSESHEAIIRLSSKESTWLHKSEN